jgi:hypothetical protein
MDQWMTRDRLLWWKSSGARAQRYCTIGGLRGSKHSKMLCVPSCGIGSQHMRQGIPAPPQLQACFASLTPPHGCSGCSSHT